MIMLARRRGRAVLPALLAGLRGHHSMDSILRASYNKEVHTGFYVNDINSVVLSLSEDSLLYNETV